MSLVSDLLRKKGHDILSVSIDSKLSDAIKLMAEKNIGAVLVLDGPKISGIFSERDFVKKTAEKGQLSNDTLVSELMTKRVLFVSPLESVEECMAIMLNMRIRHLPVIDNEKLVGLISISDVVNSVIENQVFSLDQLQRYISGSNY